jgi:hypothetical protein
MAISLNTKDGDSIIRIGAGTTTSKKLKLDMNYTGENPVRELQTHLGLSLIPHLNTRVTYIYGPSGLGKSTLAAQLANEYKMKHKNDIMLITPKKKLKGCPDCKKTKKEIKYCKKCSLVDPYIDVGRLHRIPTDAENFVLKPITLNELIREYPHGVMVVCDDYESCEKSIKDGIVNLINQICIQGRSHNIYVVIVSHLMSNYRETRVMMSEAQCICFPTIGAQKPARDFLKLHAGMTKEQIDRIMAEKSRWVQYVKMPGFILTKDHFFLI